MIHPLNTLFVLADAGHARLVSRSHETGDYFTLLERRNDKPQRQRSPGVVFQRFGYGRSTTDHGEGPRSEAKFIRALAQEAAAIAQGGRFVGIALVAPPRIINLLRRCLPPSAKINGELAKDLTKVRDHDLAPWLRDLSAPLAS